MINPTNTSVYVSRIFGFFVTHQSQENISQSHQRVLQRHRKIIFSDFHCVKSFRIRSFSGSHFPAFGLIGETYFVSLCIQSECVKIRARKLRIRILFRQCSILVALPEIKRPSILLKWDSVFDHDIVKYGHKFLFVKSFLWSTIVDKM